MKIVLSVDGSARSFRAIDYLGRHRSSLLADGASLTVVHVTPRVPAHAVRRLPRGVVARYYAEEAAKVIEPVEAALKRQGIEGFAVECRHGRAAEQILEVANQAGAELIVLGQRAMVLFGRTLPGSVAAQLTAASNRIAVLLVP
jgi:nucleotide-binding universal stress UspA family protein